MLAAARRANLQRYLVTVASVASTLAVVALLDRLLGGSPATLLLYLIPVILAASRFGRGPALLAASLSILGHDWLFVGLLARRPQVRVEEVLGLVLLLFTASVTAELADGARRHAQAAAEASLAQRANALKTALLRAVSHELRSPLATIKTSVSALRQDGDRYSAADRAELLGAIEDEADRLTRLVTNLLDASRLDTGTLQPRKRLEDFGELLAREVQRVQAQYPRQVFSLEVSSDLPLVALDHVQIAHALANLLENAARHGAAARPVLVRAYRDTAWLRCSIEDHGPGIPPHEQEQVFAPFARGRTAAAGTGLGLSVARGFVEAHGGRLWLERADSGGARFQIQLPVAGGAHG